MFDCLVKNLLDKDYKGEVLLSEQLCENMTYVIHSTLLGLRNEELTEDQISRDKVRDRKTDKVIDSGQRNLPRVRCRHISNNKLRICRSDRRHTIFGL